MVKLTSTAMNELLELLGQLMEDEKSRRSCLLLALGNDVPVLQDLIWSGSVVTFVPHMVGKLADYGEVSPGKQALWALLEYVRSQVGLESQQRIDKLRPLIDLRSPSLVATDTTSDVETLDVDLLVQQVRSRLHDKIQRLHGTMQLLDVAYPVEIDRLYVDVNILTEPTNYVCLEIDDLLQGRDYRTDFNRFGLAEKGERVAGLKAIENYPKLMVLGKPGSGKTTFLQHILIECNNGDLLSNRVPILIKLREFVQDAREIGNFSLRHYINSWLRGCSEAEIETLLEQGKVLLLLDGLDEVPEVDSDAVVRQIERFVRTYEQNRLIVTCRIQAQKYRFDHFAYVEVADFNKEQIANFAEKWFMATAQHGEQEGQAKAEQFMQNLLENQQIRDLAVTPILLGLTCRVFGDKGKFYSKPAKLYEQGLEILLSRWDKSRGIKRDWVYRSLTVGQKQSLLSYVAACKFEQHQYVLFEQREIQEYIADYLDSSLYDGLDILKSIEAQHGLLIERAQQIYSFSHLTFQEYFTARSFVDNADFSGLSSHITKTRWREVFLLAVDMTRSADELLLSMKEQVDAILAIDEKLQQFLIWVNQKSLSVKIHYKPAAIRAFYFSLARDFDRVLACDLDHILACNLDRVLSLANADTFTRIFACDRNFAFTHAVTLPRADALALYPELEQALQLLKTQLPDVASNQEIFEQWWKANGQDWFAQFRAVMISHHNIGHNWQFSNEQRALLQYYDANKLLVDCLNSSCVVSDCIREEIEETLLLPIAEIKKRGRG